MKKWVVILFICCSASNFSQTNISPQFSELKGMEDQQGNTHLFYRIFSAGYGTMGYYYSNSIWRLEPSTGVDLFFLRHGGFAEQFDEVNDLEFWGSDYERYIYAGTHIYIEPFPEVYRFDQIDPIFTPQIWGVSRNIELSKQDTNLIILSVDNGFNYKSTDWGNNWDSISIGYEILSLSPFNNNVLFANQAFSLLKSTDMGNTYFTVDTGKIYSPNFIYDDDESHMYAINNRLGSHLVVSNNLGEQFSWQTKYSSDSEIFISIDESISGTIYLADKKNILLSTDYGNSFSLYKSLDRKIVGIYKKPNSNKLYAATKYKIYEITPDAIQGIKSLPIPEDAYKWFPLNIDDKWIYLNTFYGDLGDSIRWVSTKEVTGYKTLSNKVFNEILVDEIPIDPGGNSGLYYEYFRIDSSDGKIYKAEIEDDSLLNEDLYMDLLVEVGDTIQVGNGIYLESEVPATIFGVDTRRRNFYSTQTPYEDIKLAKGFGLTFKLVWELVEIRNVLKGCIIDGVIYGDTTTVGVEDEEVPIADEFRLEQNYPNPFNPSTKIRFVIPNEVRNLNDFSSQAPRNDNSLVTLKVYDVLGNEIATLVNEEKPSGEYEVEFSATGLPSGIYFYQLKSGSYILTKKMVLLK